MRTTRLLLAAAGIPLVTLAAVYVLRMSWADRLPSAVVSHWGLDGPDRGTDLAAMTGWTLGIGAAIAVLAAITMLVSDRRAIARDLAATPRSAVGFAAWAATLPAGILAGSMWATLDLPAWEQARGAGGAILLAFGISIAAGALAAWLAGTMPRPAPAEADRELPSAGLEPGQDPTWSGAGTNYPMAFVGAAVLVAAVILQVGMTDLDIMPYGLILVVALLAMSAVCRTQVRIDSTGVTLTLGLLKFPTRRLDLDEIASADVEQMSMWAGGGYGLRRGPSYTAFKVRAGDTLAITLTSGHTLKATVDHPERAAGLINDLVGARG
ncbi:hypothetical protein BJF85_22435 [Saccharomonospora sp. CUA-673]|uniref:hypothetical protein n=1 Tax=Saccharomonospora sp. CUA-673 TaxID=1904969 RepID=UPI00095EF1C0|nr:hypothetical protein [Saccharomonospora sp. CUA-673]OLT42587.1 hypothetical protein BJF85_22435 [Saccharomonospora sp. CUA-673]